jgi:hypothetical protein
MGVVGKWNNMFVTIANDLSLSLSLFLFEKQEK